MPQIDSTEVLLTAEPKNLVVLVQMIYEGKINSRVAKDILFEVVVGGNDPMKLVSDRGLDQNNSEDEIQKIIDEVITSHSAVVSEYRAGKESALQFLVGQGMKISRGSANPRVLQELLKNLG